MPSECIDGQWRFTGFDAILPQRPVMLPLYKFWQTEPDPYSIIEDQPWNPWGNRYEGRFLIGDAVFYTETTPIPRSYLTNTGPTDVARWHLYHGGPHAQNRGAGTSAKLHGYRNNLAAMRELCQQIPGIGIMVGNCGAELAFHHLIPSPEQKHRELANLLCIDFICETGAMVKAFGGRPFWAPMERDVLIDAYHCDGRMAEAVKALGGVMFISSECSLFPRWTAIYGTDDADGRCLWEVPPIAPTTVYKVVAEQPGVPDVCLGTFQSQTDAEALRAKVDEVIDECFIVFVRRETFERAGVEAQHPDIAGMRDDRGCFVDWDKREAYPYRTLLDYFREYPIWYAIGYSDHFLGGLDNLLALHGVKALVY